MGWKEGGGRSRRVGRRELCCVIGRKGERRGEGEGGIFKQAWSRRGVRIMRNKSCYMGHMSAVVFCAEMPPYPHSRPRSSRIFRHSYLRFFLVLLLLLPFPLVNLLLLIMATLITMILTHPLSPSAFIQTKRPLARNTTHARWNDHAKEVMSIQSEFER